MQLWLIFKVLMGFLSMQLDLIISRRWCSELLFFIHIKCIEVEAFNKMGWWLWIKPFNLSRRNGASGGWLWLLIARCAMPLIGWNSRVHRVAYKPPPMVWTEVSYKCLKIPEDLRVSCINLSSMDIETYDYIEYANHVTNDFKSKACWKASRALVKRSAKLSLVGI